jgi:hypothetical protein
MEYDPETDAKGDGDILVDGELIYAHGYLGDEYSRLIVGYLEYWNWDFADTALQNDLEEVPPLTLSEDGVVVELPGMSTELDMHQLQMPRGCFMFAVVPSREPCLLMQWDLASLLPSP